MNEKKQLDFAKALLVASYLRSDGSPNPSEWLRKVVADADALLGAIRPQSSSPAQSAADSGYPAPSSEGAESATAASGGDVCVWTWQTGDFYKRACNGELREKDVWMQHSSCKNCGKPIQRVAEPAARVTDEMVTRFLGWRLPDDFAPDGGVTFDREHCAKWPGYWPVGTNLLTAPQAKAMLEHVLGGCAERVYKHERDCGLTNDAGKCECPQKPERVCLWKRVATSAATKVKVWMTPHGRKSGLHKPPRCAHRALPVVVE